MIGRGHKRTTRTCDKWQYHKFPESFLVILGSPPPPPMVRFQEFSCDIKSTQGHALIRHFLKAIVDHFAKYQAWLEKQPLPDHSKGAYRSRLNHFLGYLVSSDEDYRDPFKDATERDYILKDTTLLFIWQTYLRMVCFETV